MSSLGSLSGKPKTYTIGGIQLELKPRTVEDIDLAFDLADPEKKGKAMRELIKRTLSEVEGATKEEVALVGFKHVKELAEAVIDVNGLAQ